MDQQSKTSALHLTLQQEAYMYHINLCWSKHIKLFNLLTNTDKKVFSKLVLQYLIFIDIN